MAVKKRSRKSKGKQHPVHAESLGNLANDIAKASDDVITKTLNNGQLLAMLANIFAKECHRVQGILR